MAALLYNFTANAQTNAADMMTEAEVELMLAERSGNGIVYIDQFITKAKQMRAKRHCPVSLVTAIAILESGLGGSDLSQKTSNLFGLCCSFDWTGPMYSMPHDQFDEETGKWITVWTCFRSYPSDGPEDSIEDFFSFIFSERRPWYSKAYGCGQNLDCWIEGLKMYATDPSWGKKLKYIIDHYHLAVFDKNQGS